MSENWAGASRTNYGSMRTQDSGRIFAALNHEFSDDSDDTDNAEILSLSENVTTNIYTVNSSWKTLEHALKSLNTGRDNQGFRDKVHVTQLSCNQIVTITTRDLHRLSLIVRKGNKKQKLQVEKLTNDFKEAVQFYGKFQKKVADQMKVSLLKRRASRTPSINDDEEELLIQKQQQIAAQKSLQQELEFEQGLLVEREHRILQIEGDILDINQIMRELGAMVHEQGEAVNSIENNIENVHGNVELGQEELAKAAAYQNKFRRKLCFLAALALIVGIVLAIILITQLKS